MKFRALLLALAVLGGCQADITLPPADLVDASDASEPDAQGEDAQMADAQTSDGGPAD